MRVGNTPLGVCDYRGPVRYPHRARETLSTLVKQEAPYMSICHLQRHGEQLTDAQENEYGRSALRPSNGKMAERVREGKHVVVSLARLAASARAAVHEVRGQSTLKPPRGPVQPPLVATVV